jgi:hypothetical protein
MRFFQLCLSFSATTTPDLQTVLAKSLGNYVGTLTAGMMPRYSG